MIHLKQFKLFCNIKAMCFLEEKLKASQSGTTCFLPSNSWLTESMFSFAHRYIGGFRNQARHLLNQNITLHNLTTGKVVCREVQWHHGVFGKDTSLSQFLSLLPVYKWIQVNLMLG